MSSDQPFDHKYWNLAQAAAWVEYRDKQLVEELKSADRNAYIAIGFYLSMWPPGRKQRGQIEELRRALEEGRLISSGFRRGGQERLEGIPAAEWADFVIRPPLVFFFGQTDIEPWGVVRVQSADMKRLWRSIGEVEGRSTYDWAAIRPIYELLKTQNPEMSKNELITEAQGAFEDRFNKGAPSITSFKRKIKTWT
jgi:hypothetical protein